MASELEQLEAEIYTNPSDLERRAVFADCLQAAGDPRGEFIALQLLERPSKEQARRTRALKKAHWKTWLGALEPVINHKGLVFRHGFPTSARLQTGKFELLAELASRREWATLAEIDLWEVNIRQVDHRFLSSAPVRRGLRSLRNISISNFALLAASPTLELRRAHIGNCDWRHVPEGNREEIAAGTGLAELRELDLRWVYVPPSSLRWLVDGSLWRRLSRVRAAMPLVTIYSWVAEIGRFFADPDQDKSFVITGSFFELHFFREDGKLNLWAKNPHTGPNYSHAAGVEHLRRTLREFTAGTLDDVTIVVPHGYSCPDDFIDALERCMRSARVEGRVIRP